MLRPVKSAAGRRTLVLPPSLAVDLRHHRRHQAEKRPASEVWEEGPEAAGCLPTKRDTRSTPAPTTVRSRNCAGLRVYQSGGCMTCAIGQQRLMLDNDLDLKTAGQVLGHSQLVLTACYQHVLADRKSVAAGRIEAAVFGKRRRPRQAGRPSTAP